MTTRSSPQTAADPDEVAPSRGPSPHAPTERAADEPASGTRLSAKEIHQNVLDAGDKELHRRATALLLSALAAGLVIGFSFLASAYLSHLTSGVHARAAAAAGYPLGFILVILARSELFTENTAQAIIPALEHRSAGKFLRVLRTWGLIILGNVVGALLFGLALARTGIVESSLHPSLEEIARHAVAADFATTLYTAVFAGWLLALLSWVLASTRSTGAQIALIWLLTAPISALGFRHSIAGAVESFYYAARGAIGWGEAMAGFIIPALLGNAIGGVIFVGLLNTAQVKAEEA